MMMGNFVCKSSGLLGEKKKKEKKGKISLIQVSVSKQRQNITQGRKHKQQGKSEGFESCDQPIVRKHPIWVKIGDVLYHVT